MPDAAPHDADDSSTEDKRSDGALEAEPPQEEIEKIEAEREERLDPSNRPEGSEIDNSQRDFDATTGAFADADHDEELGPFEPEGA
jgi:hypothetical protein